jgi:hypothetical protein
MNLEWLVNSIVIKNVILESDSKVVIMTRRITNIPPGNQSLLNEVFSPSPTKMNYYPELIYYTRNMKQK